MDKIKKSGELKGDLAGLPEGFRAPSGAAEKQFKNNLENISRRIASMLRLLNDALEDMEKVKKMRAKASKRWQANYDFMLARLQAQIAYLYEYQSMLGQMRKEFPRRDPEVHGGWRLASQTELTGDAKGKRLAKNSRKLLDQMVKEHAGTPWEVLAKREKLTALGLEWKPTR